MRHIIRYLLFAAIVIVPATLPADPGDPPLVAPSEHHSPADELKAFHLPPGFEAQLVASEPDIQKPLNMAFDAQNRLWVTCTVEYPYPAPEGKGRDSIKVLSDFGPDGKARSVTTFADGLNIPIGLLPYKDGAIVYSIPNLWRLRDTDGDGKCDKREVLYSGFGTKDTHGMINGLTLGFDGWVYCCHGYMNDSVVKGTDGSEVRMNSGNVFRVKPDGSRVEIYARGQVNPFGQCVDELGNHYTACCHSKPITQLMRGAIYSSFAKPHDGLGFGPDMVHEYRGSTALCGLAYYQADQFPQEYAGRMFLGDVVNNCINIFDIDRQGATYTAKQQKQDFLKSDDAWFRPVDIKLGPDGTLYVADFYNRIIGHYEVPLNHPGRDRSSGRIWRIVYKGADGKAPGPHCPQGDWTKVRTDVLIRHTDHVNLAVRMMAMHQLVERGQSAAEEIRYWLANRSSPTQKAHLLWALERLGKLDHADLEQALSSPDLIVRVHALRILAERTRWTSADEKMLIARLRDSDNLVLRVLLDALTRHPDREWLSAVLAIAGGSEALRDPFLRHAGLITLRAQLRGAHHWPNYSGSDSLILADVALGLPEPGAAAYLVSQLSQLELARRERFVEFVRHAARYAEKPVLDSLTAKVRLHPKDSSQYDLMLGIVEGLHQRGEQVPNELSGLISAECTSLLSAANLEDVHKGVQLSCQLRSPGLQGNLLRIVDDRQRSEPIRLAALDGLASFDARQSAGTLSLRLADTSESLALREKAAQILAMFNSPDARSALVAALPTAPARLASAIASGLAGTIDGAIALLDAITAGKASPRLLLEKPVQVKIAALKRSDLEERARKLTEGLPPADAQLSELLKRRAVGYAKSDADVAAGAKVFEKHCAACHQISGKGSKIGPQLDGIGVRGLERLLEDTLDPNRNVDQSFRSANLSLKNGQQLTGLLYLREEGAVLVFADGQGKEQRFGKDQITERETSPLSPMPANWADQIGEKDFNNLMAYLLNLRSKP